MMGKKEQDTLNYPQLIADIDWCYKCLWDLCQGAHEHAVMSIPPQKSNFDVQMSAAFGELRYYRTSGFNPSEVAELAAAKRDGRLVIWPCSPDKPCYAICQLNCELTDCPNQDESGDCENNCPNTVVEIHPDKVLLADLIRLPLFASREAAEATLATQSEN